MAWVIRVLVIKNLLVGTSTCCREISECRCVHLHLYYNMWMWARVRLMFHVNQRLGSALTSLWKHTRTQMHTHIHIHLIFWLVNAAHKHLSLQTHIWTDTWNTILKTNTELSCVLTLLRLTLNRVWRSGTHTHKNETTFLIKGQIRVDEDENLSPLAYYLVKSIPLSSAQYQVDLTSKMIFIPKCSLGFVRN